MKVRPKIAPRLRCRCAEEEKGEQQNSDCDEFGICKPLILRSGSLFVQLKPDGEREPHIFRTGAMKQGRDGRPYYAFPEERDQHRRGHRHEHGPGQHHRLLG
jgi:hypothetical protein